MADRQTFLAQIREQTARGRAYRVAVNPDATAAAAYVGGGADPVETFLREWRAVGGKGERVAGRSAAQTFIGDFIDRQQVKRAIRWRHPVLETLNLDALLAGRQVELACWDELERQPPDQRWATAFAAELGITSVDWAVAETGSLALCSKSGQGRVVSLLPPVFLAVIEPGQIVPDLFDLFEKLEGVKHDLPSNVALITGPSKTGDIELKLTTGVHGPGDVNVLVIE